ncbi:nuclease-related domain-containing protein [Acetobacter oryzifermentans]|uniref:nuclease-related domain-containing protein n=1 Tax=Acetobacter oryzifermentans TaxID=1633874 RepID=UPI0039BFC9BE
MSINVSKLEYFLENILEIYGDKICGNCIENYGTFFIFYSVMERVVLRFLLAIVAIYILFKISIIIFYFILAHWIIFLVLAVLAAIVIEAASRDTEKVSNQKQDASKEKPSEEDNSYTFKSSTHQSPTSKYEFRSSIAQSTVFHGRASTPEIIDIDDEQSFQEEPSAPEKSYAERKGFAGECIVNKYIKDIRKNRGILKNIYIEYNSPTGKKVTQIDHIVKVPWGIFVIETKYYSGYISHDPKDDYNWVRQPDDPESDQRYKFYSPLRQNQMHVDAVRLTTGLEEKNIFSLVVLAGKTRCDSYIENRIVRPSRLKEYLGNDCRPPLSDVPYIDYKEVEDAWSILLGFLKKQSELQEKHKKQLNY